MGNSSFRKHYCSKCGKKQQSNGLCYQCRVEERREREKHKLLEKNSKPSGPGSGEALTKLVKSATPFGMTPLAFLVVLGLIGYGLYLLYVKVVTIINTNLPIFIALGVLFFVLSIFASIITFRNIREYNNDEDDVVSAPNRLVHKLVWLFSVIYAIAIFGLSGQEVSQTQSKNQKAKNSRMFKKVAHNESYTQETIIQPTTKNRISFYSVVNVKSDDVLNLRSKPNYQTAKTGMVPFNATGIKGLEDTTINGKRWIKVEYQHYSGWANAHYLKRTTSAIGNLEGPIITETEVVSHRGDDRGLSNGIGFGTGETRKVREDKELNNSKRLATTSQRALYQSQKDSLTSALGNVENMKLRRAQKRRKRREIEKQIRLLTEKIDSLNRLL